MTTHPSLLAATGPVESDDGDPALRLEELVRRSARRDPGKEALRIGSLSVSYGELMGMAESWAAVLRAAHPADTPQFIGVLCDRTFTGYTGILAALCAGAAVVPLAVDTPPGRLAGLLRDQPLDALIVDEAGAAKVKNVAALCPLPPLYAPESDPTAVTSGHVVRTIRECQNETAYVMFTSGSTGRPKGVSVTHASACHFLTVVCERYGLTARDVFSQTFSLTFDLAFFDLFAAWSCGGTLVYVHSAALARVARVVEREGLTVWFSVPGAIQLARRSGALDPCSMPSLRWSLFCGEPLLAADAAAWQRAASGSTVENLYGPTELTIACTAYRWDPAREEEGAHGIVPIGELFPGLESILLAESDEPATEQGELCVTGPQMFSGYLDPADDEGRFFYHDGRWWYRTGDLVRRSSHAGLIFLGRTDLQIKIRGYRIEPAEVEHHLRLLPGVEDVIVLALGEGAARSLVAFCAGSDLDSARLESQLREELPAYMVPRRYVVLDRLPVNERGKTDRKALATSFSPSDPARP
ncbi:AMP-binding protein [Streptomyces sp. NPDC001401]|uniref:AMP-binding protein n=1 Tax=Streptomyces sp. NPDC001401 TaxID=3364570 RepID=UPI0036AC2092